MDSTLDRAEQRLSSALDALRGAVHRRRERERSGESLRAEAQAMADDRARLAAELDKLRYRSKRLEDANRQVLARVDQVIGSVRTVLEPNGGDQPGGPGGAG